MTKKICVLSSDNHSGYLFYFPIVEWIWHKHGWEVALFVTEDVNDIASFSTGATHIHTIPTIPGVRTNTLAQTVRHFVADVLPKDAYIMVQDIDLLPLQNYWNPDLTKRTIWGYPEMTGGTFIPVHYTGMLGQYWYELMGCTGDLAADMEREMKANGRAYKEGWENYWDTDWDILTQKVRKAQENKVPFEFIPRSMVNGLPFGRVDRSTIVVGKDGSYSWGSSGNQSQYIDAHCESHNSSSPEKWKNIRALLEKCYGPLPEWMDKHAANWHAKYKVG